MKKKGTFITFEGLDGSSKTTQSSLLLEYLKSKGLNVLMTREPGGTKLGEQVRNIVLQEGAKHATTELLLFMAARNQHIHEVIKPALQKGMIVICDRFVDSTAAYQTGGIFGLELIYKLHQELLEDFLPDLTLLLNLSPETAKLRRQKRNETSDIIETRDTLFHHKVYQNYQSIAHMFNKRVKLVDADNSIQLIKQNIFKEVNKLLNL